MGRGNKYSWSRFCTVNCSPSVSNYQLFHIRSGVCTVNLRGWKASVLPLVLIRRYTGRVPLHVIPPKDFRLISFSATDILEKDVSLFL